MRLTLTQAYSGPCLLRFPEGVRELECLLVVEHCDLVSSYSGLFEGLSSREIRSALAQKLEFELELGDGRKARVTLTDGHGSFVLVSELS